MMVAMRKVQIAGEVFGLSKLEPSLEFEPVFTGTKLDTQYVVNGPITPICKTYEDEIRVGGRLRIKNEVGEEILTSPVMEILETSLGAGIEGCVFKTVRSVYRVKARRNQLDTKTQGETK